MVVYFSGTGNSRFCAARLATLLDDQLVNSAEYLRNNGKAELNSEKPWVFVCPIYAWQMPSSFAMAFNSFTDSPMSWSRISSHLSFIVIA